MSTRHNTAAATRFLGKALRSAGQRGPNSGPRVICTDKVPTYTAAIAELIDMNKVSETVEHRKVKYLNNVIEGDRVRLKQILGPKGGGFKKPVSAYSALQRLEAMHPLRKGQGPMFAFGEPNPDAVIVSKAFAGA